MKTRFCLFRRSNEVFFLQDDVAKRQESLRTRIRRVKLFETQPDHFLEVLKAGTASTDVFLRRFLPGKLSPTDPPVCLLPALLIKLAGWLARRRTDPAVGSNHTHAPDYAKATK